MLPNWIPSANSDALLSFWDIYLLYLPSPRFLQNLSHLLPPPTTMCETKLCEENCSHESKTQKMFYF